MKTITTTVCSFAAFAMLGLGASPARADHDVVRLLDHIHQHAHHVQDHSRDLAHEVRHELYFDANYRHLVADINLVIRSAARVEVLARSAGYVDQLCREARELDRLVHHLEETLDRAGDRRSVHGHHHGHGYRHVHRPNLREARRLVRMIEKDTHDLLEDVERLERRLAPPPVVVGRPAFERPGVAVTPGGLYFGSRGISFRIAR